MTEAEQLARDSAARYAREVDVLGDRLTAVELERDTLAARLAAVEALADQWAGHVLPPEAGHLVDAIRAAVRAEPSETTT